MSNLYRLVGVGNAELVAGLSKLVQQSNALTAQVLAHLVEFDERQLQLELGFYPFGYHEACSSLFAYCVEGLGMSEGAAGRRVTAARVCRRFPDAFARVARGELHLCALCALAPHLNEENAAEWFDACKGKTRRQIEGLLAARFPRPDVREQIRRLPARDRVLNRVAMAGDAIVQGASGSVEQTLPPARGFDATRDPRDSRISIQVEGRIAGEVVATRRPEAPVIDADASAAPGPTPIGGGRGEVPVTEPRVRPRARELEPLSADRFGVHFTADAELRDLIERARELASHQIPKGDLAGLMKLVLTSFVKQTEKRRFGIGTKPRRPRFESKPSCPEEPPAPPDGASKPAEQAAPCRVSRHAEPAAPPRGAAVLPRANETPAGAARPKSPDLGSHSRYLRVLHLAAKIASGRRRDSGSRPREPVPEPLPSSTRSAQTSSEPKHGPPPRP